MLLGLYDPKDPMVFEVSAKDRMLFGTFEGSYR